jgi:hypothetical protein
MTARARLEEAIVATATRLNKSVREVLDMDADEFAIWLAHLVREDRRQDRLRKDPIRRRR